MSNSKKTEILTKRARKAKRLLDCSNIVAFNYAKSYANYLESVKVNAPCLRFDEWILTK